MQLNKIIKIIRLEQLKYYEWLFLVLINLPIKHFEIAEGNCCILWFLHLRNSLLMPEALRSTYVFGNTAIPLTESTVTFIFNMTTVRHSRSTALTSELQTIRILEPGVVLLKCVEMNYQLLFLAISIASFLQRVSWDLRIKEITFLINFKYLRIYFWKSRTVYF